MANIAQGEYICQKILIKSCVLSYKQSGSSVLSVYCILYEFNTFTK